MGVKIGFVHLERNICEWLEKEIKCHQNFNYFESLTVNFVVVWNWSKEKEKKDHFEMHENKFGKSQFLYVILYFQGKSQCEY